MKKVIRYLYSDRMTRKIIAYKLIDSRLYFFCSGNADPILWCSIGVDLAPITSDFIAKYGINK